MNAPIRQTRGFEDTRETVLERNLGLSHQDVMTLIDNLPIHVLSNIDAAISEGLDQGQRHGEMAAAVIRVIFGEKLRSVTDILESTDPRERYEVVQKLRQMRLGVGQCVKKGLLHVTFGLPHDLDNGDWMDSDWESILTTGLDPAEFGATTEFSMRIPKTRRRMAGGIQPGFPAQRPAA